jgi:transcriptional regulator with XRE-family HTH domain
VARGLRDVKQIAKSCREVWRLLTSVRYGRDVEDAEINARLKPGSAYADLRGRHITVNQVVAWNLAYFRKAAGLTQDELGEQIGWSKAIVSAAERSWDGKRVRQFSADDVVAIAAAFGLPVVAMFLPPEDDGVNLRYLIYLPIKRYADGDGLNMCYTMHDLMLHVVPEPSEGGDSPDDYSVMRRYWNRYVAAVNGYLRADTVGELADYVEDLTTEERIVEHLARLRGQYDALREMISDNDHLQSALTEKLLESRGGRGVAADDRRTPEQREWDARVADVLKEMFGAGGYTRDQVNQAMKEATRRGFTAPPPGRQFDLGDDHDPKDSGS